MLRGKCLLAVVSVVLCALVLCGCASKDSEAVAATSSSQPKFTFILVADGQITVATSTGADSIEDVLEKAGITLRKGDILSVRPDQVLSSGMVVEVLRYATVYISLVDGEEEGEEEVAEPDYTVSLLDATVGDALQAAGIDLTDVLSSNFENDEPLYNGMRIKVSLASVAAEKEKKAAEEKAKSSSGSGGRSGGSYSGGGSSSGGGNSDSSGGRTVVSTERYDDCDGSGHGVMVITYSDGTQEERPY